LTFGAVAGFGNAVSTIASITTTPGGGPIGSASSGYVELAIEVCDMMEEFEVDYVIKEEVVMAKEPISDWAMRVGAKLGAMREELAKWMKPKAVKDAK
jgi:hypothetical protein